MHHECTRLTVAANKYYNLEYAERFPNIHEQRAEAVEHFLKCAEALEKIGKGYIENPIGIMSRLYKKPTQIIQPYQFGHAERKSTCLWILGLPKLQPTNIIEPDIIVHKSGRTDSRLHYETLKLPKEERRKARSKTFEGIAKAMAEQWTLFFLKNIYTITRNLKIKIIYLHHGYNRRNIADFISGYYRLVGHNRTNRFIQNQMEEIIKELGDSV